MRVRLSEQELKQILAREMERRMIQRPIEPGDVYFGTDEQGKVIAVAEVEVAVK